MEMMIITGLQDFAAYVTIAVGTFHPELLLIILLAVRHPVSVENRSIDIFLFDLPILSFSNEIMKSRWNETGVCYKKFQILNFLQF